VNVQLGARGPGSNGTENRGTDSACAATVPARVATYNPLTNRITVSEEAFLEPIDEQVGHVLEHLPPLVRRLQALSPLVIA
jgi:hypothetical protein